MKLILTDIDDTILKFADRFQEWVEAKGYQTFGAPLRDTGAIMTLIQKDRDEVDALVTEFSMSPDVMACLHPEPDALEVLPELHRMGYEFAAISSCVDGPYVTKMRRENVENVFGFSFRDVHCTGLLKPKDGVLTQYEPTWWVEDNGHHATVGAALGHSSLLLDRPYNQSTECKMFNPLRVPDWYTIYDVIVSTDCYAEEY